MYEGQRRFRYRAFLSYSHTDNAAAHRLHRVLERYRVPRGLVGTAGLDGPIPANLFPIFRDREELAATASLSDTLRDALDQSAHLVVLCSPAAAGSRWVNEEVASFKRSGRASRIHAIIVADSPSGDLDTCFPPALVAVLDEAGAVRSDIREEPIAADLRPGGDPREDAHLKVIAAVLGLSFNDLRQREILAARRRRFLQIGAGIAVAALCIGLGVERWQAINFHEQADEQQNFGVRVVHHTSVLDLTDWQPTTPEDIAGHKKKSSAVATDDYNVVRTQLSSPTYKHIIGTSSDIPPDVSCDGCTISLRRDDAASRTTHEYRLSFDIAKVPLEDSLPVHYATTYWNAFQTPEQWWTGVRISELTESVTFTVIFPPGKAPLASTLRFHFKDIVLRPFPTKPDLDITPDAARPDRVARLSWHISFPLTDRSYRITWDWSRDEHDALRR